MPGGWTKGVVRAFEVEEDGEESVLRVEAEVPRGGGRGSIMEPKEDVDLLEGGGGD